MKFTDGYWQVSEHLVSLHPAEARDIVADAERGSMTVFAPTRRILDRGDTLNRPLITLTYSTPMADVIGVRIEHHRGGVERGPQFAVAELPVTPEISVDDSTGTLTSGDLSVVVHREPWLVEFRAHGSVLTASRERGVGLIRDQRTEETFVHEQLSLAVGDTVYGLGERFGPLAKNGQVVDIWNADGGTSSEKAYKNVPFYLTNAGYGVFVRQPENVSFEVGSEKVSRVQFSVPGQSLEYFVIYGPTPKEILRKYTALTGRPPRVPEWSFGLWLSTSFTTSYDEATVSGFVAGMAEREIPLSVFHYDCFWMREFHWSDFEWDPATFPDPEGQLTRLKKNDLRVCVWINPYIAQRSALFDEARELGYLVKRPDGSVWQWDMWQAGMALVDFTNPAATAWFQGKLRALMDMGVDAFKTDFGERIPTDVVWHDGSDPERMHNYYAYLYNEAVFSLLKEERGEGNALVFARSATAGGQEFPVHWGGDCHSTFDGMGESIRGGLSLALSGFGYWSHDIGGFEGTPDPEVFKRWTAFGLLSSHSRLHGSGSYRVPWAFDEEAVEVMRLFTHLKLSLMPYLARAAEQVVAEGTPMMRPMVLEFPDDLGTAHVEHQYMLGDSLLVAPVFRSDGDVSFYLPAGRWTHLLSGVTVEGPRWVTENHDVMSLPLYVRPDSVVAVGSRTDSPQYDYADGVRLRLFELADGHRSDLLVPACRGVEGSQPATFEVRRAGTTCTVTTADARGPWSVEVGPRTAQGHGPGTVTLSL